jgi:malonate transporter
MSTALSALLPVFLLIAAGFALRHTVLREEAQWHAIARLTFFVLFPALIVGSLARADLARVPVLGVGAALFLAVVIMAALCLALRPLLDARLAVNGPAFTSVMQGATRWNTFVVLALAGSLYDKLGIELTAVAMVAMIPVLNLINVWTLAHYAAEKPRAGRAIAGELAGNPMIWSCIVGLALNLLGIPVPEPIYVFVEALGRASLPLALLTVGAGLHLAGLVRPLPAAVIATALKLVLMPAIAIALALLLGVGGPSLAVVACCASVPTAPGAYVMARQMGGDAVLMAQILTLQTVLAVFTIPVVIALAS